MADVEFVKSSGLYVLVVYTLGNKMAFAIRRLSAFKTDLLKIKLESLGYN